MSRSTHQRTMPQAKPLKQYLTEQEAIAASELFDLFCVATTMRQILGLHRDMCDILGLRPAPVNEFYPMLKAKIRSWKAQALWKKFDARAAHRVYAKGTACNGTHVLVIGAGPCGLRTAIEAQLLGAKVVVVEKRDRITRNNVLHLWPFVITDLRNLGAKKFYGKFCAGSIDHISIRQLQIILMKVALLLGVEIHENVSFERTIEPSGDGFGWRAAVTPADHVVSYYEFDVLIGADGKRNTLEGFKRKEFRGKLAIAITANFINKKTEAEAKAEEISGVAFIFNQSFFKELYEKTGIDLENIVYYKDETHYFVMTAKKHSLIDKGVILQDFSDPAELLASGNVSAEKLLDYAREAAEFSTKYQMPNLEFAVNHYGKPDVAMFDFTSMFAAETSCRVMLRHGHRLLQCLVGDSLLEPFWPTGSGCARGFLSSMDAAYVTKLWSNPRNSILGVVAQRESIYRLLNQTTPENLQRDTGSYTVDPASRYPNLNRTAVSPYQVKTLIDSDDPKVFEQPIAEIITTPALAEAPALLRKSRRSTDIVPEALLHWVCTQLHMYDFVKELQEPADILKNGKSLCALISRFRPDLIDYSATRDLTQVERNEVAFRILEAEYQLPRIMSGEKSVDLEKVDTRHWLHYLNQVREVFRGEVPYLKHPKMDISELREKYRLNNAHAQPDFSKLLQLSTKPKYPKAKSPIEDMVDVPQVVQRRSVLDEERVKRVRRHEPAAGSPVAGSSPQQGQTDTPRRAKKRRNVEKVANIEERQKRIQEIEQNRQERVSKRRQQRYQQTQNFYKSLQMLQANTLLRETDDPTAFEDYSLFIYRQHAPEFNDRVKDLERKLLYPDRNRGDIPSAMPRNNPDEQFSDRIKSMEQRISSKNACGNDKKPKDLMRAIGKIDSNDWNVREIEKKIEQSKRTEIHGPKGREKVPKWSKEQFLARQNKMAKPTRQESVEEKFKEIDQTLKNLDKQLKEGSILEVGERGRNKVASIAGQFVKKDDKTSDEKNPTPAPVNSVPKSSAKVALAFKKQAASEKCHFCKQIVYLMEKITAEDLVFHRSCLKCHHCHTNLRLGGYAFDRDDPNGRFYCTQHFKLPSKAIRPAARKPGQRKPTQQQQAAAAAAAAVDITVTIADAASGITQTDLPKTPDKLRGPADSVVQLDLLDRGQTPERIEFENTDAMSDGEPSEEHILDEHEWSGRNFLPESNQDSESDLSSSDDSDSESDADMFEEANDSPLAAQTLQLATDWIGKQHYSDSDDSDDFYDSSDGIADDDGKDDTEGEDFKKARELRREEVRLQPLPANLPTDTETEVQSESESTSPEKVELNSATEISTDSEFDHDEIIRETPKIFIDDTHLRKPTKVQIKSTVIASTAGQRHHTPSTNIANAHNLRGSYLQKYQVNPPQPQFKPLVQVDPTLLTKTRTPLQNPRPGDYLLNKTASTEGIASKKSLELKKRYLLGEQGNGNKIQKSGSTSVLDSRIRSFQSNISECQKLLNPGSGISASMKTFLDRTKLGESTNNDLMGSATTNILNDLKVEITIQKASSTASTDNEKENVFVNSKNELNKGMEYSETVNTTLVETINNKKLPSTPTNSHTILGTIDLVTPEKEKPNSIIDITKVDIPTKMLESNINFIENINVDDAEIKPNSPENNDALFTADSNKIIDLTCESPVKSDNTIIEELKPDVSKDVKERIPDLLGHIGQEVKIAGKTTPLHQTEDQQHLLSHSCDEEKMDSPEKLDELDELFENDTLQIQVPNIPWSTRKMDTMSSTTGSSCTSSSSSIEDIQHYILESTTSPDTQTGGMTIGHQVPRVEIHDTSGTLMQIDSLMIIDGKYIGDPEDLKYMEIPAGVVVPETPIIKTSEIDDENEADMEPITATPEPVECTVIEAETSKLDEDEETEDADTEEQLPPLPEKGPPLPERGPPNIKTSNLNLKFDTKNENKVESLKHLPLIVEQSVEHTKAVKPVTLNLSTVQKSPNTPTTPTTAIACSTIDRTPKSPLVDSDITPTGELMSRGSDSETEMTGTGQGLTETELSDWTADDCISENFIDMEFVLNSNKGTIKRNKKEKRGMSAASKLPTTIELLGEVNKTAPVAEFEGILKSIDIDDIEFMDTGSEGSCAEGYSATNTALLRNRGYVEFIETTPKQTPTHKTMPHKSSGSNHKPVAAKRDEKSGIDYIEQGAYILQNDDHEHDLLKTPVNEEQHLVGLLAEKSQATGPPSLMTQSLTDSSTLNDLEDDSLFTATPNSQIQLSTGTTTKTTTEESEALTVVTSPLDTSSPKVGDVLNSTYIVDKGAELTTGSTPSSSDKNPKTSQSTCTTASTSTASSNKAILSRGVSQEIATPSATAPKPAPRKPSNELSYEECVRALQQKITQISTGRDSDVRKQRRKSSKGEMSAINAQTVIEATPTESENPIVHVPPTAISNPSAAAPQIHKVPEIPTLTRKLEEITKERTKQKDLIHDLVMDKLQSKKQLNAEKRLHRSRQRTMLTSGYASGSSLSPTPKIAAATTITDTNCTSRAHYHESTAATPSTTVARDTEERSNCSNFRDSIPLQKSSTYVSAYGMPGGSPTRIIGYHQRPFSEHLTGEQLDAFERYKLTKTPSFSYGLPNQSTKTTLKNESVYNFVAPNAPARHNRTQKPLISTLSVDSPLSASTENLRTEARARARLKSNTELGLSPEDKMQLLRQRLHLEHLETKNNSATALHSQVPVKSSNDTEQQRICDRRLSASKSVNDLAYLTSKQSELSADVNSTTKPTGATVDFTSDPNLLLSSTSIQCNSGSINSKAAAKSKSNRRQKDPERRKSLIQSLSSFFHKEKKDTGNGGGGSAVGSAQSERLATSGNNGTTASGGIDMGILSRFRISPKTKEKSKDKDDYLFEAQLHNNTRMSNASSSNSNIHLNTTPTKNGNKKSSKTELSSSSPQLFIHRPNYVAKHDTDEPAPPPIPPLPLNYQRSDDESNTTETREPKRQRAISKAVRQAELKRLRIAQEIQREQEEIEVQLKELEARGVLIEKALRGESEQHNSNFDTTNIGSNDEKLLKELLEIWRNIKQLKKRDEELSIRQQELQLEHRHAQLKEELNLRLSFNKLDKSSADVAAEGAILNEMLEIVAKRAALRPTSSGAELSTALNFMSSVPGVTADGVNLVGGVAGTYGPTVQNNDESNI